MIKRKKIPGWLQPTLWSVKVDDLDLEEDKVYIINQVLACGGMQELKWLFKVYPKKTIKEIFVKQPIKIYYPATFNFCKLLLDLEHKYLDPHFYDRNLPRLIRR